MKDRIEVRLTVATTKVGTGAINKIIKVSEPFLIRIADALTKVVEKEAEKEIKKGEDGNAK